MGHVILVKIKTWKKSLENHKIALFEQPVIVFLGDVVPERFRSLIRPKTLVNGESYSHKFSRSDWDLTNE